MTEIINIINLHLPYITIGLSGGCLLLLIINIIVIIRQSSMRKAYNFFMKGEDTNSKSLEERLIEYSKKCTTLNNKYTSLVKKVDTLEKNVECCVQKVGVVRYRAFEQESSNDLCFSVAILDSKDNGVVFNSIYSRTGSYTYAKPIERGISTYVLSNEEKEAIEKAKKSTFVPPTYKNLPQIEDTKKIYKLKIDKKLYVKEDDTKNLNKIVSQKINSEIEKHSTKLNEKIDNKFLLMKNEIKYSLVDELSYFRNNDKKLEVHSPKKDDIKNINEVKSSSEFKITDDVKNINKIKNIDEITDIDKVKNLNEIKITSEFKRMKKEKADIIDAKKIEEEYNKLMQEISNSHSDGITSEILPDTKKREN